MGALDDGATREAIITALPNAGATFALIHGSTVRGTARPGSDIDITAGPSRVLDQELATQMRRAVGFRNVLVHEYVQVDDEIVLTPLKDSGDLEEFARQVAAWLKPG